MKSNWIRHLFNLPYRRSTHSEMIEQLLKKCPPSHESPIFIEIGAGFTTLTLAEIATNYNAVVYSCDNNHDKVEDLQKHLKHNAGIHFMVGDSLEKLSEIKKQHEHIHFVFFDSAPSAMHTFNEFKILENCFNAGSCILIDNAALPEEKALLTPCRKGKIIVPYLLASPFWKVTGHPHAGDSMVSATLMSEPNYADPAYELTGWIDSWKYATPKDSPNL